MKYFSTLLFSIVFSLNILYAQQGAEILVIPYSEEDLCHAFDKMTLQQREGIDEITGALRKRRFRSASFVAVMRKARSQGACDGFNPKTILRNVLKADESDYYITVEYEMLPTEKGNYVALNLSLHTAETHKLITYESVQSDVMPTQDVRALTRNAFEKIADQLLEGIDAVGNPTSPTITTPLAQGKIKVNLISDISKNLPKTAMNNPDAIAVVIGNANYEKTKAVNFALNDAALIKQYLISVLGYREGNVFLIEDARKSDFELMFGLKGQHRGKLFNSIKAQKSDVFVFYSGHGAPGLTDKSSYFIPVDCDPQYVEIGGYATETLYQNLGKLPAKSVTVVIDACFSGLSIHENISPLTIKPKGIRGVINGTLLASSADDQVSAWYPEQGHGLFTYFFLKAIHQANADANQDKKLSLLEIYNFIANETEGMPYYARRLHGLDQKPFIDGMNVAQTWIAF